MIRDHSANPQARPPRWFIPAIIVGGLVALAGLVAMGYYLYDPPNEPIAIGERSYLIPPSDLAAYRQGPPMFVRVRPSGEPFDIVHDGRLEAQSDGKGLPFIFSVNDRPSSDVTYSRHGRSVVLCRRASSPSGGCGTWVSYGGRTWAILFPEARASDADQFVTRATALLRRYDSQVRGLLS